MRTLGIDLGRRRVGLALSDESGKWATPHDVLTVSSPDEAIDPIVDLIHREAVRRIVVGLPLNMDDTLGPPARKTIEWGQALGQRCGLPVVLVDERLSSFAAEQQLIDRKRAGEKLTRRRKKARLDALAAAGFLQGYLDGKLPALAV
jgi:putative Holliday junction resolvase